MQNWWTNVHKGMNVCDMNGDKVGTVKDTYDMGRTVGGSTMGGTSTMGEGYVHLDTGFLGLGKDLYIPLDSFDRCTADTCYLNITKKDVDTMGWDQKPTSLR